jgi:hypothetical protein
MCSNACPKYNNGLVNLKEKKCEIDSFLREYVFSFYTVKQPTKEELNRRNKRAAKENENDNRNEIVFKLNYHDLTSLTGTCPSLSEAELLFLLNL